MAKTGATDKPEALKRIGGGRWETRDGRFQIEPQSGTWVIVDTTQTNEFGLPLVRGPFPSLTAAKTAIESARDEGPVTSPLAGRIDGDAKTERAARSKARSATRANDGRDVEPEEPEAELPEAELEELQPASPPEPLWIRNLKPVGRQKARDLIEKLTALGIEDAEAIAHEEIAEGHPALARYALAQRIREAIKGKGSVESAVEAAVDVVVSGEDEELGVGWGLVDDRSRPIDEIDLAG